MPTVEEQFLLGTGVAAPLQYARPARGLWKIFDWLERPLRAVSEAYGAYRADEDVSDALLRGLTGRYRYPTLGYQLVPKAQVPGFQVEDIPAFAIDVLADPVNILMAGAAKPVAKVVSRGVLKGFEALTPKFSQVLGAVPEMEKVATRAQKIKHLQEDARALGLGPNGLVRRFEQWMPDPEGEVLGGMWEATKIKRVGPKRVATWKGIRGMLEENEWAIDAMRDELRKMNINLRPQAKTNLQSLAQEVAMKFWPTAVTLKRFGGRAGLETFQNYKQALNMTRMESIPPLKRLQDLFKGVPEKTRIQSALIREGRVPHAVVDPKAVELADEWGKILDTIGDDVARFRDPLGNPLQVWNDRTRIWEPFEQHWVSGYYPHRYPKEVFTKKGRDSLIDRLVAQGVDRREANRILDAAAKRPRRVGHIEKMRHGTELGYEMDPAKVLPKYIHDVTFRKNLARVFGTNSEILNTALDDMTKVGLSRHWLNKVGDLINGTNIHDRAWERMGQWLTGFQALTKLGYATTVANGLQAPINQFVMFGPRTTLKGLAGMAQKKHELLGLAAFNRAMKDDVVAMATGGKSWLSNKYMNLIGFNLTEHKGRHMGAIAGLVDVDRLGREWAEAFGTNPKVAKRKAWQLRHRYDIDVTDPEIRPLLLEGRVPERLRELAALDAADKTMHAFTIMELPPAWRDPMWRTILQFKSFIYKQMDFITNQVAVPGMHFLATDGAKGDLMPLLRAAAGFPLGAELVIHLRDIAKSVPAQVYATVVKGEPKGWDYKKPFWEDPDPGIRLFSDLTYIGTLGILGDALEAAAKGRLWKYAAGPTISDIIEGIEAPFRGRLGEFITREAPGALGIPYGADIFEEGLREWRRWQRRR